MSIMHLNSATLGMQEIHDGLKNARPISENADVSIIVNVNFVYHITQYK